MLYLVCCKQPKKLIGIITKNIIQDHMRYDSLPCVQYHYGHWQT